MLRISNTNGATAGGKDTNMREHRGKAKQFTTINGKTVIIKDAFVYANKGTFLGQLLKQKVLN